jgi:CubicO group peptidase (beta-lactamase class C family)
MRSLALVAFIGIAFQSAGAQSATAPLNGLDRYVTATMPDWGIPGAAIAVVKDGKVVYARGFGVRRLGDTARVNPETMFAIGSITKSFTAAALGILVDEKKVSWTDPVTKRLPGFAMATPEATASTTIEDLLSHRTGLPGENVVFWGSDVPRSEVVRRIRFLPLAYPPRTVFDYQNLAFVAAGEVIPAVTQWSWDDLVERRIFKPLGMSRSTTKVSDIGRFTNVASPHAEVNGKVTTIPWLNLDNAGPAGSIVASVTGMAQYVKLQLGKGTFEGTRVLSDSVISQLHSGRTIISTQSFFGPVFADSHFIEYGLGWFLQDYHGYLVVTHGGQTDGMHANLAMVPELGLGVVVLTNAVVFGYPSAISYRVLDAYLGRPAKDWSKEMRTRLAFLNGSPPPAPAEVATAKATIPASGIAGRYRNDYLGEAVVSAEGQQLYLAILGQRVALSHWRDDQYTPSWTGGLHQAALATASFEPGDNGQAARLKLGRWTLQRLP